MTMLPEERDWTYSEGCGCQVTFFAASGFQTSRMTPGDHCTEHIWKDQLLQRTALMERAKMSLLEPMRKYLQRRESQA